ncbi:hypothetical protein [Bradyrhizobium sp. 2TAF24]|uniref:hypothetical protein n=1 Tax=Bradyrhizobium sp. 2TAF24 TaxID=3233011 RepID=UPI003F8FFF8A
MFKALARRMLRAYRTRYGYDTSYLDLMLQETPSAFFKFALIMGVAQHRKVVPLDAYFAAKLVGAMAEDCGPCTQLVVDMAREAKVPDAQIEAVLAGNCVAMTAEAALGYRFAHAIVARNLDEDEIRNAVRAHWGEAGVIELTLALQIGRIFPMVKTGLGHTVACRRINIAGRPVDVARTAVPHAA